MHILLTWSWLVQWKLPRHQPSRLFISIPRQETACRGTLPANAYTFVASVGLEQAAYCNNHFISRGIGFLLLLPVLRSR